MRLHLEKLQKPQKAFALVRESRSTQGALLVAKYCQGVGDHRAAIEFLIIAKRCAALFSGALPQLTRPQPNLLLNSLLGPICC